LVIGKESCLHPAHARNDNEGKELSATFWAGALILFMCYWIVPERRAIGSAATAK
jgi:hypothetical protein